MVRIPPPLPAASMSDEALFDLEMELLLEGVYRRWQHDFRHYAPASMRRRVRQAMERFGCDTVAALQHRVLHEPGALTPLLEAFTVHVSEFFRDPPFWRALREQVLPVLRTYPSFKCWVAGCSTGEEAWSLAIVLAEAGLLERALIYATDIDPQALRIAESGIHPTERLAAHSARYLEAGGTGSLSDWYHAEFDNVVFDRKLRAHMVFADHSLATDAVFSEVHLVTCRNVLIYFDTELQDRAVGLFRESLVHRGFLGLGSRESLRFGRHADAFEELPGGCRLHRLK